MNLKSIIAASIVAIGMAASANAALLEVSDSEADAETFATAIAGGLTLDPNAVTAAGSFDSASHRFNFSGAGSSVGETFDVATLVDSILTAGNVIFTGDYTTAKVTIDGVEFDFLANPGTEFSVAVSDPISFETNFVSSSGAGTFDFAIIAVAPVPIPAGILLLGTAIAGFGVMRRRRKVA